MMMAVRHSSRAVSRPWRYPNVFPALAPYFLLLVLLTLTPPCQAYKDSNVYPWGSNPNTLFKNYWKDAANVIQDLDKFQALYIQVHGCVWSECGVDNFDDDGENHDGDETWYETRTRTFCANAAYSLYGIRKNNFKLVNTCSKGTYINTFFTYGGADTLAKALDLNVNTNDGNRYSDKDDDSYGTSNSDCVAVDNYGRNLNSDSGDDDDGDDQEDYDSSQQASSAKSLSTTMGCAASPTSKYNRFVTAGFSDYYCSGRNFLETLSNLKSYNKAMNRVKCTRIWSLHGDGGNNNNDDGGNNYQDDDDNMRALLEEEEDEMEGAADSQHQKERHLSNDNNQYYVRTYNSVAEQLLYHSWACDLSLYPQQCPDPYGLKRKYFNVMKSAANGQPIQFAVWNARLRKPIQIITVLLFVIGLYLSVFAYTIRNRAYITSNGGGVRGFGALVARDIGAAAVSLQERVKKAKARYTKNQKSRRGSSSAGGRSKGGSSGGGVWGSLFGKKKKKKKRKKKKSLQRTLSGRSLEPEAGVDEASVYTEMTDDYSQQRSGRYSSANYSSSRTSKAAEAAFAAAAQFDLEQQQQHHSNRHAQHHPSILPSPSHGGSSRRSRSTGRGGRRGRSRSPHSQGSRGSRSHSMGSRRMMDPSPTRSPGGSSIRRAHAPSPRRRSKSPQSRVFV